MLSAAASMAEIGELKEIQLDYKEAASYFRQASESVPKGKDLVLAHYLGKWGVASYVWGKYEEAERPLTRSLEIHEKALGKEHSSVATCLNNLGALHRAQGKYAEAQPLFKRALAIVEKALGKDHPDVATVCVNMAKLCKRLGKKDEAKRLEARARKIRSNQ